MPFALKKKTLPVWIKNRTLARVYQSPVTVLVSYWIAQGVLYMLPMEMLFKGVLEVSYLSICLVVITRMGTWGVGSFLAAVFVAHTLNCLTNGHVFNVMRFCYNRRIEPKEFLDYPVRMKERLAGHKCLCAVAIFGSLSRKQYSGYSDLDVRVVAGGGLFTQLAVCVLVWRERVIALLLRYPIDIYMVSRDRGLEKLRSDEPPVILLDDTDFLVGHYRVVRRFSEIQAEHQL